MAIDVDKSHEVSDGLSVYERSSGNTIDGPFYTGGPSSPVGLNLPERTFYLQNLSSGVLIWRKFGNGVNDWRQLSAEDIPYDDSLSDELLATDLQEAVESLSNRNFGKNYSYNNNPSVTTTSSTFVPVVTISETKPAGTYRTAWSYQTTNSKSNTDNETQVVFNNNQIALAEQVGSNINTIANFDGSLIHNGGALTLSIEVRRLSGNGNALITSARLEIWRIL